MRRRTVPSKGPAVIPGAVSLAGLSAAANGKSGITKIQTSRLSFLRRQPQQRRAGGTPGLHRWKTFASLDFQSILFMGLVLGFLSELAGTERISQKFHSSVSQTRSCHMAVWRARNKVAHQ